MFSTEREPQEADGKRLPAWRTTLFESAFAAVAILLTHIGLVARRAAAGRAIPS